MVFKRIELKNVVKKRIRVPHDVMTDVLKFLRDSRKKQSKSDRPTQMMIVTQLCLLGCSIYKDHQVGELKYLRTGKRFSFDSIDHDQSVKAKVIDIDKEVNDYVQDLKEEINIERFDQSLELIERLEDLYIYFMRLAIDRIKANN